MSRDIFLRPLAAADAFVHSAPNPKQRSRSEVDRLGTRATAARFRIPIPSGFMPVIVTAPLASLKLASLVVAQFGNHGPIRDSWPIAFWGCPRGHRVGQRLGAKSTQSLNFRWILSLEPERLRNPMAHHQAGSRQRERTLCRDVQTDTCCFSC